MVNVVCLGELLIDFVALESGVSLIDAPAFKKAAGGAPANVAVGLARLGHSVGFVGKVGDDSFGEFLAGVLRENGVDISGLAYDHAARTMLAFVSLTLQGERDFMFYRHPSADMRLTPAEIPAALIQDATIFHYGSISLISEPCRSATLHALALARQANLFISYDPNLRLNLWDSPEQARREILGGMPYANLVKVNEGELEFLTGTTDLAAGSEKLLSYGPTLVIVTLGGEGSYFHARGVAGRAPVYAVQPVDTTGSGDGFVAGLLSGCLAYLTPHQPFVVPDHATLAGWCRFANAVGALTALTHGAIPSLPTREQVEAFLARSH